MFYINVITCTVLYLYSCRTSTIIKMTRKFCVGGNWKMNGDKAMIADICKTLTSGPLDPNTEVIVGCPAPYLAYARSLLPATINVSGQVSNIK